MKLLNCALLAPVALTLFAATAQAAAINHTVLLSAEIPTDDFHVEPRDMGWIGQVQKFEYNVATKQLQPIEKVFEAKHTTNGIHGSMTTNAQLIGKGTSNIALTVKFNGVELTTTPAEVLDAAEAAPGKQVTLEIIPAPNAGPSYEPGDYKGQVNLAFDAAP